MNRRRFRAAGCLGFALSLGEASGGYEAATTPRGSGPTASPTRGPTPTGRTSRATPTVTGSESPEAATTGGSTGREATDGAVATDRRAGHELEGEETPAPEDLPGFGAGAAVTGLAGWLGIRRLREDR